MGKIKRSGHSKGPLRWVLAILVLCGLCVGSAWEVVFRVLPSRDPEKQFTRENIQSILSGETRVYYNDGKSLHGAFFDANHRVYVPYDQIPVAVVNALVAAEDSRYFEHGGFDPRGFLRAVVTNIRAGAMVQGGSTLTQQTAKNIFGREERSLSEKFYELENALKLEKNFTKQEILEFYLNQFYVAGTGRGLLIAAWHFFSKDLSELSLAECAFIAGSVKGPANYDPFIQKTPEAKEKAIARAQERLTYVLRRMLEDGYINQAQLDGALKKPLQFRVGQFRFAQSSTMQRIEDKLNGPYFKHLFDSLGIDSWQKAQLKIVTTLDAGTDLAASGALQENLADLQMKLGGFSLPKGARADNEAHLRKGEYLYGSLDSVSRNGAQIQALWLRFGASRGVVSRAELDTFSLRHKVSAETALSQALRKGTVYLVRVLDSASEKGMAKCRIETEPVVQGGMVALQGGNIRASQGGFHNTGYDRVNQAVRQFGSAWKPLLFASALQLGWHYTDTLDNVWNLFSFGKVFYFPRPDHEDRAPRVSIAWAAARSENIASIWLLDHLLDRLDPAQLREVALRNGYLQKEGEDAVSWRNRLRDSLGLMINDAVRAEIPFVIARDQVVRELRAQGNPGKAMDLGNLIYGNGIAEAMKDKKRTADNREFLQLNFLSLRTNLQEQALPADSVVVMGQVTLAEIVRIDSLIQPLDDGDGWMQDDGKLFAWPDFRKSLAMAEFARFAHDIGIRQKLRLVQSMPLGTNEVPLLELTVAYQSLFSGKSYQCRDGEWNEPCLIQELRNASGKVIFQNSVQERQVLADSVTAQIAVMLRETFESGTARSGNSQMVLESPQSPGIFLAIPAAGKTGTTNDYRNVAFVGAIPSWDSTVQEFKLVNPLTISSYVGFDDNRALQKGGLRIAGASGALPPWVKLARSISLARKDASRVDFLDLSLLASGLAPWSVLGREGDYLVDAQSGLVVGDSIPESGLVVQMPRIRFGVDANVPVP